VGLFQGLVEIVLLWVAAAAAAIAMGRINRTAGLLMIPYMAWLSLATALNYAIWINNPAAPPEDKDN